MCLILLAPPCQCQLVRPPTCTQVVPICLQQGYFFFLRSWPKGCGTVLSSRFGVSLAEDLFDLACSFDLGQFFEGGRVVWPCTRADLPGIGEVRDWVENERPFSSAMSTGLGDPRALNLVLASLPSS